MQGLQTNYPQESLYSISYTVIECLSRFMENVAMLALAYETFPILSKVDLNIQMFLLLKLFRADLNNFSKLDGNQNTMFF